MEQYKRIVVKIGSSTLTYGSGNLNIRRMEQLVKVLSDIKNSGAELIVVSSGAMAIGFGKLGFARRPEDIPTKQAAAAVGQCELMYLYDKQFSEYNRTVAQVLLTNEDVADPGRQKYIENTLHRLIELGCIPIINENDTVAVSEIEAGVFNENDTLSAIMARLLKADLLVLVSDIDGLYDSDPHVNKDARLLPVVGDLDYAGSVAAGPVSGVGRGGMSTKIAAARIAADAGADTVILNGNNPDNIYLAVARRPVGTLFPRKREPSPDEAGAERSAQ